MLLLIISMFVIFIPITAEEIGYKKEMADLICEIRENAGDNKIIILQNGTDLLYNDSGIYGVLASKIDGVAQESLLYGEGGYGKKTPSASRKLILKNLLGIKDENKKILLVNYTDGFWSSRRIKKYQKKYGFIGETPEGYEADSLYKPLLGFNSKEVCSLEDAENFLYLLNPGRFESMKSYVKALEDSEYDILIIDPFYMGRPFSSNQIEKLKQKKNGARRLVIAYFSVGEAESYRSYWEKEWDIKPPHWIVEENPEWEENYIVKYWEPDWGKIVKAYQKQIDSIGFDGYFLDTVDTYQFFEKEE